MTDTVTQAKRSNAEIVELIEKTKVQQHVEERKRKREDDSGHTNNSDAAGSGSKEKLVRKFRQTQALGDQYGEKESKVDTRFLKSVFGKTKADAK